eukprot:CAMPEP_0117671826 /NCGR_PEP_ID=MMETSP0804-20121206/13559_1 /TAXON_ID=1074897 /ORGANISM="Tetraselmis astigmatica, Strain CCMP880" /LENGTH=325 /DNA_ID=CAMNT_0005480349 /DNA_START=368 /DNA_END=1346 /DNA_ORIENTATION=-
MSLIRVIRRANKKSEGDGSKVDPVMFQCYKTTACFLSSFLVLAYVDFKFTWWGVLGASIWVFNGIFAIMAVQMAGLGVSQSLWSGLSIFVSFIWGAYVFHEPIKDYNVSIAGLMVMALGMMGIGYASSPKPQTAIPLRRPRHEHDEEDATPLITDEDGQSSGNGKYSFRNQRRATGLLCAVYVGVANGSFMVPFKKVPNTVKGIEYLPSFGIGAMLVTVGIVTVYFCYIKLALGKEVPSFQWEVAHKPAFLTGILWSLGNFFSIYATQYLGLAVGWPLVQCQLIVSTTWSIVYFKELTDPPSIACFALSSIAVLAGVIMLGLFGL